MNMRKLGYGVFLFILAVILKLMYPSYLVYTPLHDTTLGIVAAFIVWTESVTASEKEQQIGLFSKLELYFCVFIGIIIFLLPFYVSITSSGLEAALIDLPLLSFGVLVFIAIMWVFGSLIPRLLYRYSILKVKESPDRKPGEPLGKLFG